MDGKGKQFRILESQQNAIFQRSLSAEIQQRMEKLMGMERSLDNLSQEIRRVDLDPDLKNTVYRKYQLQELKEEFSEIQVEYFSLYNNLHAIGDLFVVLN